MARASEIPPGRGCVKGTILLSRVALVRGRGGEAAVKAVLARMPTADQELLRGIVLPVGWYPFEVNERLDAAIAKEFGGDAIYRSLGAQSAIDALGTTHKNFVRQRDAHGLLKHVAQLHRLYKDSGYMTYEWVDRSTAVIRTYDCKSFSAADCLTNLGWHEKAVELCGGRNVRATETRCRANGEKLCEYHCAWEARPPTLSPAP
jgi:predicted hydrocarbon binding protein